MYLSIRTTAVPELVSNRWPNPRIVGDRSIFRWLPEFEELTVDWTPPSSMVENEEGQMVLEMDLAGQELCDEYNAQCVTADIIKFKKACCLCCMPVSEEPS